MMLGQNLRADVLPDAPQQRAVEPSISVNRKVSVSTSSVKTDWPTTPSRSSRTGFWILVAVSRPRLNVAYRSGAYLLHSAVIRVTFAV